MSTADGERWLRVVAEMPHWAGGAFWTGNLDAHAISGVPKPRLLTELDWSDGDCELRAELMTLAPSPIIANDMVLRNAPDLAPSWWADLRGAVDALAAHPTERVCVAGSRLRLRLLAAFVVEIKPAELEWTCAHGDLHWANLTAPLLDSPSGQVAQLAAILKLLCLVEDGEHLDIAAPLHRHARTLIAHL